MAQYIARRSGRERSVTGNPLRRITDPHQVVTMSGRGLVLDSVYHVDSIVRADAAQPHRQADPRVTNSLDGYSPVARPEQLPSLKISNLRIPQPTGWISPAEFGLAADQESE